MFLPSSGEALYVDGKWKSRAFRKVISGNSTNSGFYLAVSGT